MCLSAISKQEPACMAVAASYGVNTTAVILGNKLTNELTITVVKAVMA